MSTNFYPRSGPFSLTTYSDEMVKSELFAKPQNMKEVKSEVMVVLSTNGWPNELAEQDSNRIMTVTLQQVTTYLEKRS
ncbi:hypothetical protein ACFLWB_00605 [Chloroflexota bacterium]